MFSPGAVAVLKPAETVKKFSANLKVSGLGDTRLISWTQQNTAKSSIRLFSVNGKLIKTLDNGYLSAGAHSQAISLTDIASGMYVLQLRNDDQMLSKFVEKQ